MSLPPQPGILGRRGLKIRGPGVAVTSTTTPATLTTAPPLPPARRRPPPPPPKAPASAVLAGSVPPRQPTLGPPRQPAVMGFTVDPATAFPTEYAEIQTLAQREANLATKAAKAHTDLEAATGGLDALGALPVNNASFRGKNAPSVYAAFDNSINDYVAQGNFSIDGFPFRVTNENSFNSVLAAMKAKRQAVRPTLSQHKTLLNAAVKLDEELATVKLEKDRKTNALQKLVNQKTAANIAQRQKLLKSRKSGSTVTVAQPSGPISRATAARVPKTTAQIEQELKDRAEAQRRAALTPEQRAAENAAKLAATPKKSLWQRMTGRGRKTRRSNRKTRKGRKGNRK
jgi:hypothetical protein